MAKNISREELRSSESPIKRLGVMQLLDFIEVASYGLEFYEDNSVIICLSDVCHQKLASCFFNPKILQLKILKLKNHFF